LKNSNKAASPFPIPQIDFEGDTSLRDKFVNLLKKREERTQKDSQTASNKWYVA
jgi:hypothetical protein